MPSHTRPETTTTQGVCNNNQGLQRVEPFSRCRGLLTFELIIALRFSMHWYTGNTGTRGSLY